MELHRDLSITQKSAWHLPHRNKEAMAIQRNGPLDGPVEVDETFFGSKRRIMRASQRKGLEGRGPIGKSAVVGMKDRTGNTGRVKLVRNTAAETLQGLVVDNTEAFAIVCTVNAAVHHNLVYYHEGVKQTIPAYPRGRAHTNGVKSYLSAMKRAQNRSLNRPNSEHLNHYIGEFVRIHNVRELDTLEPMVTLARRMDHKRPKYQDLIT